MSKLRLLLAVLLSSAVLLSVVPLASAHVLKQSNGVTVVMHIAPFDDPAANEKTRIEFEYGTDKGTFSLTNYEVSYQLSLAGKAVVAGDSPPAYFGSAAESIANLTFPRIGVYSLTVTGKPTTVAVPDFKASYDIRVDHSATVKASAQTGSAALILLAGSGVLLGIGFLAGWQIKQGKRYVRK